MGEAKRRRAAGMYPRPDDPLAAAKRFWRGRNAGPVEHFRTPEGTVAVTADVQGVAPVTFVMNAADVTELAGAIQRHVADQHLDYRSLVRGLVQQFVKAKRAGDDDALNGLAPLYLWTSLHHPDFGCVTRTKVSAQLRDHNRCHISWQFSNRGLMLAVAGQFVDLEAIAACAPPDRVFACVDGDGETLTAKGQH